MSNPSPSTASPGSPPSFATYCHYNESTLCWDVTVPTCALQVHHESLGSYKDYDEAMSSLNYYFASIQKIYETLGVNAEMREKTMIALRIRVSSLESLLYQERERSSYQIAHLLDELTSLRASSISGFPRVTLAPSVLRSPSKPPSPPYTPPPASRMDRESPHAFREPPKFHGYQSALNGYDT